MVEITIMNTIHFLSIIVLTLQLVQGVSKRISTFLIKDPGVFLIDEVVVQFHQMFYTWTVSKLLFGRTAELKEVSAEPNLFYMRLVAALSYNLLYSVFLLAFFVLAQPD